MAHSVGKSDTTVSWLYFWIGSPEKGFGLPIVTGSRKRARSKSWVWRFWCVMYLSTTSGLGIVLFGEHLCILQSSRFQGDWNLTVLCSRNQPQLIFLSNVNHNAVCGGSFSFSLSTSPLSLSKKNSCGSHNQSTCIHWSLIIQRGR
jgi:hypothetical protein